MSELFSETLSSERKKENEKVREGTDGSAVKTTALQEDPSMLAHSCLELQLRDLTPSSGLHEQFMHVVRRDTYK